MVLAEIKQRPGYLEPEVSSPVRGQKKRKDSVNKASLMFNLTVFIFAFAIVGVALYVHSALLGYQIVDLKKDIAALENENRRIEYTIAELSSLERVQAQAEAKLGMFRPQSENMVAFKYEPPITEQGSIAEAAGTVPQTAALKKDYQVISSILGRVGFRGSL